MFDKLTIHLDGTERVQGKPSFGNSGRHDTKKTPNVTNLVSRIPKKVLFDMNEHVTSILKTVTMRSIVCSIFA